MENRDRDKLSKNTGSTSSGNINRDTSSKQGKVSSDSNADFGQNIGRSESWEKEPGRRSGSSDSSSSSSSNSGSRGGESGMRSSGGRGSNSGSRQ